MSLKNLSFPIFVIITIFVGVFWIKPSIESIFQKRDSLAFKIRDFDAVLRTQQNLNSLLASRESIADTDAGKSILGYLPISISQDRVVDIFNYYAIQSGATINKIVFDAGTKPSASSDALLPDTVNPLSGESEAPIAPILDTFTLHADIQGSYDNIRSFLKAVSHSGRSQEIGTFSIAKNKSISVDSTGQPVPDNGILSGNIAVTFNYLPLRHYAKGYLLPVFSGGAFDLSAVNAVLAKEGAIPALVEPGSAGRTNPFSSN